MQTLTYIMHIKSQILILEKRVVVEATSLDLLEKGADVPSVQDIQQHDARHPQGHVQHCLQFLLCSHVFVFDSFLGADLKVRRHHIQREVNTDHLLRASQESNGLFQKYLCFHIYVTSKCSRFQICQHDSE